MRYFETKVRYDRKDDNGSVKTATEVYAVAAQTFSDAEHIICEKANGFPIEGEFEVIGEKIAGYDLFLPMSMTSTDSRYYEVKYAVIYIDEYTAKEKKDVHYTLVEAMDVQDAAKRFVEANIESVLLMSVKETPVIDVFAE